MLFRSDGAVAATDLIQPGMRAYVLHVDGKSGAPVGVGNRIDIVAAFELPNQIQQSGLLLQDILVLGKGAGGMGGDTSDLALSVTLPQAEMLALAEEKGRLSAALRADGDLNNLENPGRMTHPQLYDIDPAKAPRIAGPSGPQKF